ncbi:hypothetical protein [Pendulispora albinea]|uniref:Uncharacterized protein n=1 Tax=Pendulispora albinea TaxID=2741071 RepID=A0ABZ2LQZ3_9BACT
MKKFAIVMLAGAALLTGSYLAVWRSPKEQNRMASLGSAGEPAPIPMRPALDTPPPAEVSQPSPKPLAPMTDTSAAPEPTSEPAPRTARDVRAEARAELMASARISAPWSRAAPDVVRAMDATLATAAIKARFSDVECFERGCITTLVMRDGAELVRATRLIAESDAFQSWRGGKYKSPPIDGPSGTETDWILYPPQPTATANEER